MTILGGIRPGYKQTEMGVVPEGWECGLLDQFWTVTDCKHVTAPFVQRGFPLASIKETQARLVDLSEANQTTELFYRKMIEGGRKPVAGDLIFSRNATVGEVAQVTENHPLFAMGQDVCLLKKRRDGYSTDFLQSLLKAFPTVRQIEDAMVGSTFKRVNVAQIKCLVVVMPDPPEQRAIAAALADADGWIAALEGMIAKKRDLKQAVLQHLLTGKTRLPGFSGEWEAKRLGECASFFKGKGLPKSAITASGRLACIHYGELFTFYGTVIDEVASRTDECEGAVLSQSNDVLMPTSDVTPRGLAKASCLTVGNVVLGGDTLVIRPEKSRLSGKFLAAQIRYREGQVLKLVTGSTVFHLYASDMKKFELPVPTVGEQTAIAEILSDMDTDLAALEEQAAKARAVKQGMMQELLTGRVRLV